VLLLGIAARSHSVLHAETRHETQCVVENRVSLVPLYTARCKTLSSVFTNTVTAALKRTYTATTDICEPEFYDGADEGAVMLDYLAKRHQHVCRPESPQTSERNGRVMGVTGGPIRARVDGSSSLRYVCGFAYRPSELDAYPTVTVITTHEFDGIPQEYAAHRLGIVAIHELGHNFGAWDCNDRACFMSKQIEWSSRILPSRFCKHHSGLLWPYLR
jgi:predicted Zn-dependent protease